jgi:hypothetical protein
VLRVRSPISISISIFDVRLSIYQWLRIIDLDGVDSSVSLRLMDYWWDPCSGLCGADAVRWVVADLVVHVCRPSQMMLILPSEAGAGGGSVDP